MQGLTLPDNAVTAAEKHFNVNCQHTEGCMMHPSACLQFLLCMVSKSLETPSEIRVHTGKFV